MRVVEIFVSIQGEGLLIGAPTVFVRFSGCNLRCRWCDTTYALSEGTKMGVPEVFGKILEASTARWVCLTGGEPLLQSHQELRTLIEALHRTTVKKVSVETNGTIPPGMLRDVVDFWSVSPKLSNSGMKDRLNVDVLKTFARLRNVQFKFVIERKQDVDEAFALLDENEIRAPVVLQPQGYGNIMDTLRDIVEHVRKKYASRDVRVLPQLHVLLYSHRKGV